MATTIVIALHASVFLLNPGARESKNKSDLAGSHRLQTLHQNTVNSQQPMKTRDVQS